MPRAEGVRAQGVTGVSSSSLSQLKLTEVSTAFSPPLSPGQKPDLNSDPPMVTAGTDQAQLSASIQSRLGISEESDSRSSEDQQNQIITCFSSFYHQIQKYPPADQEILTSKLLEDFNKVHEGNDLNTADFKMLMDGYCQRYDTIGYVGILAQRMGEAEAHSIAALEGFKKMSRSNMLGIDALKLNSQEGEQTLAEKLLKEQEDSDQSSSANSQLNHTLDQLPFLKLKNQAARALNYLGAPPADCFTDAMIKVVEGEKGESQEPGYLLAVRLNAKINGTKIELENLSHQWRLGEDKQTNGEKLNQNIEKCKLQLLMGLCGKGFQIQSKYKDNSAFLGKYEEFFNNIVEAMKNKTDHTEFVKQFKEDCFEKIPQEAFQVEDVEELARSSITKSQAGLTLLSTAHHMDQVVKLCDMAGKLGVFGGVIDMASLLHTSAVGTGLSVVQGFIGSEYKAQNDDLLANLADVYLQTKLAESKADDKKDISSEAVKSSVSKEILTAHVLAFRESQTSKISKISKITRESQQYKDFKTNVLKKINGDEDLKGLLGDGIEEKMKKPKTEYITQALERAGLAQTESLKNIIEEALGLKPSMESQKKGD